ncbi:MAG: hypothetical protein KVP17_000072 [Porospora cf. gigantea B]|uniref:uncharacterized protein n=1 Tax=Porospora cf. gigantea B TaxID=2853592 RepID=UPI0035718C22|nr:MAG: hypothetical protein KVP17_000072 [Porospora cf. gigantea B]
MALLLRDISSACQGPRNCLLGRPFYVAAPEDPGPIIAAALVSDEHVGHMEGCPFVVCDFPGAPEAPLMELDSWVCDWANAVLSGDSQLQMSGWQFLQAQATFVTTWFEEAIPMTLAGALGKWRAMSLMVAEKRVEISSGPSRIVSQNHCPPGCWASRPLFTLATDWQATKAVTDAKHRVISALHDDDADPDLTVTLSFGEFDIEPKSLFSFLQQLGPLASPRHPLPPISETTLPRAASQHALVREQSTVEVTMILPKHFHALRHLLCVDDISLYRSLRRTTPFSGDGGKSGADFGLSADRRYIIKQLNPKEVRWFRTHGNALLKRLIKIQQEKIESTIVPALGLFEVRYSRCFHLGLASDFPANLADGAPEDVVWAHTTLTNRLNNSSRWKKCFLGGS